MVGITKTNPVKKLNDYGMPKRVLKPRIKESGLYGTEKQIIWALDIRKQLLLEIDMLKEKELTEKELEVLDVIEYNIKFMDDAEWFINNRFYSVAYWIKHTIENNLLWNDKRTQKRS